MANGGTLREIRRFVRVGTRIVRFWEQSEQILETRSYTYMLHVEIDVSCLQSVLTVVIFLSYEDSC